MIGKLACVAMALGLMAASAAQAAQTATVIKPVNPGPPTYAPAVVPPGRYACFAGGQDLETTLVIQAGLKYADGEGEVGAYRYNKTEGALSFASGPFAGSYARMFNARTIGMSDRGSTRLYIRCTRPN